jgi:hypothetical protein
LRRPGGALESVPSSTPTIRAGPGRAPLGCGHAEGGDGAAAGAVHATSSSRWWNTRLRRKVSESRWWNTRLQAGNRSQIGGRSLVFRHLDPQEKPRNLVSHHLDARARPGTQLPVRWHPGREPSRGPRPARNTAHRYPGQVDPYLRRPDFIARLPDGTIKQLNPFTGTQVWTVARRGHRPLGNTPPTLQPLTPGQHTRACVFREDRHLETPV